MIYNDVLS